MDMLSCIQWTLLLYVVTFLLLSFARFKSIRKSSPPGPTRLPIFGNLLNLLPHSTTPHKYFANLAKTYGPIMRFQLGSINAIVISSPTLAKSIYHRNHHIFSTHYDLDAFRAHDHKNFSIGSLSASSPKWKILRKIYGTQLLSDEILETMQNHRYQKLQELLDYMKKCSEDNVSVDVGQAINDACFNIISSTIFSIDCGNDSRMRQIKELINCIMKEMGKPNIVDCYPILRIFDPQSIRHRLTCYCVKLFKLFDEIIIERSNVKEYQVESKNSYKDMMDIILDIMNEQSDEISQDHIHHLLIDLLGVGVDLTSNTIEWAMAEILRNPIVLRKLQEEIDSVIGKGQRILEPNVSKLPYLQATVKETLRLHPAAPLLLHRKVEQDVEIEGYQHPKGTMFIVNAWAIGRDPETWADPDMFCPERFMGSELDMKSQFLKLFTFGAGKKICLGMPLALRLITLVLGNLIGSFDWVLEHSEGMDLGLEMNDRFALNIKKAESLRAFPTTR